MKTSPVFLSNWIFPISIALIFFTIGLAFVFHHEMWHDETSEWLIVRDSPTYAGLLSNYATMRQPVGWVSLLWILSKFTSNIFSMQLLNLIFAALAIFVFARFAPFSIAFKSLFAFGYFPLFEYGVISREYSLGMLLLFVFATLYQKQRQNFLLLSFIVMILANSNVITFVFSILIFMLLFLEIKFFSTQARTEKNKQIKSKTIFVGSLLALIGIIFAFIRIAPFEKSVSQPGLVTRTTAQLFSGDIINIINTLFFCLKKTFSLSFLPLPIPALHFWEAPLFLILPDLFAVLSMFIFFFAITLFRQKIRFLVLWLAAVAFFYLCSLFLFHRTAIRHYGFLYLFFIVLLWMCYPADSCKSLTFLTGQAANRLTKSAIYLILIVHIIGAFIAASFDWVFSFTQAKNAANYILANRLENKTIVGWRDDFMPSIISYANLKEIYYPQRKRFGSFMVLDLEREKEITLADVIEPIVKSNKKPEDFLFIFTPELYGPSNIFPSLKELSQYKVEDFLFNIGSSKYRFKELANFSPSIVIGETFALYKLEEKK